jgi:hypothetical protein
MYLVILTRTNKMEEVMRSIARSIKWLWRDLKDTFTKSSLRNKADELNELALPPDFCRTPRGMIGLELDLREKPSKVVKALKRLIMLAFFSLFLLSVLLVCMWIKSTFELWEVFLLSANTLVCCILWGIYLEI